MFDIFSLESDNDDIDIDVSESVTINDETAVDEAGSDSEVTDVSNISEKTAAHNEAASAGGVVVGNNASELEMDPVAASEAYIFRQFGLSREDLEEAVEETVAEAEALPNAEVVEEEEEDTDLAETAVVDSETSGGEVINNDKTSKVQDTNGEASSDEDAEESAGSVIDVDSIPETTPADTAGKTPDANDDSLESLLMSSLGFKKNDYSNEGFKEIFLINPKLEKYFESQAYQNDKSKFEIYLNSRGYKKCTFDEYQKWISKKYSSSSRLWKFLRASTRLFVFEHDGILFVTCPGITSMRALLLQATIDPFAVVQIINIIKNLITGNKKCLIYPMYKRPDGSIGNWHAIAECNIKNKELLEKTVNEMKVIADEIEKEKK